jgi:hypothetical protein
VLAQLCLYVSLCLSLCLSLSLYRLCDCSGDESKAEVAKALLGDAKIVVVKSEKEAEKHILR